MKFQDSKLEIEAPESKTYILRSAVGRQNFDAFFLPIFGDFRETYILHCFFKCASEKVCCFGGVFGGCQKCM